MSANARSGSGRPHSITCQCGIPADLDPLRLALRCELHPAGCLSGASLDNAQFVLMKLLKFSDMLVVIRAAGNVALRVFWRGSQIGQLSICAVSKVGWPPLSRN
jgi:hypothetical protein